MKLKIMIMALLLVSAVGIGSAVNRLPATEFVGNISYVDSGANVQEFDFNTEPTDGDVWIYDSGWSLLSNRLLSRDIIVGPSSDTYSFLYHYSTDGVDDEIEINQAIQDGYDESKKIIILPGKYYPTGSIETRVGGVTHRGYDISRIVIEGAIDSTNVAYTNMSNPDDICGAVFYITNTTDPAFMMGKNLQVRNIAVYYPDQIISTNESNVIEYPATFWAGTALQDTVIENIFAYNPYIFYYNSGGATGRNVVRHVVGYPLFIGVYMSGSGDVSRVEDCHFWPFMQQNTDGWSDGTIREWVKTNGTAFYMDEMVWPQLHNNFALGYWRGLYVDGGEKVYASGNGFDHCQSGISIVDHAYAMLANNFILTSGTGNTLSAIYVEYTSSFPQIIGNQIYACHDAIKSDAQYPLISGNNILRFNSNDAGGVGIYLANTWGRHGAITGNILYSVGANGTGIKTVSGNVNNAFVGNVIRGASVPINVAGATHTFVANVYAGSGSVIDTGSGNIFEHNIGF